MYWRQWSREGILSVQRKSEGYRGRVSRYISTYAISPKPSFQTNPASQITRLILTSSSGGLGIAGEDDAYDFGSGAGFYINATKEPYNKNYKMEDYITSELPSLLFSSFPNLDSSRVSLFGHSMGGHGALSLFLKNPGKYRSVSAFAPIANPSKCPWGEKAFSGYLGEDKEEWKKHDATELVKGWKGKQLDLLIDVGRGDNFYKQGQLLPENFEAAVKESGLDKGVVVRYHDVSGAFSFGSVSFWFQLSQCGKVVCYRALEAG